MGWMKGGRGGAEGVGEERWSMDVADVQFWRHPTTVLAIEIFLYIIANKRNSVHNRIDHTNVSFYDILNRVRHRLHLSICWVVSASMTVYGHLKTLNVPYFNIPSYFSSNAATTENVCK